VLLSEQLRQVVDESVLVADTNNYDTSSIADWADAVSHAITLTATKIVYARITAEFVSGDSAFRGHGRIVLDTTPLVATGPVTNGQSVTEDILLLLTAGSYTFKFQHAMSGSAGTLRIKNVRIGTVNFPDKQRNNYASGSVSCPYLETTTVLSQQSFTIPGTRRLSVGNLKKYVCFITVYAGTGGVRKNNLKNPGESNDSGFLNWKLYFDGNQIAWTERVNDRGDSDGSLAYGVGALGRLIKVVSYSAQHTIRLDVYNAYSGTQGCWCYVEILTCPWIMLGEDYEPVDLSLVPQGSTLYVVLEPLNENPTKYARIGKTRVVSFGDSTDYYKNVTGTGILTLDYTFEIVEVTNSVLNVKGLGGCIGIIGVDIR